MIMGNHLTRLHCKVPLPPRVQAWEDSFESTLGCNADVCSRMCMDASRRLRISVDEAI